MMKVTTATLLEAPVKEVWQRINRTDTLQYVTKGVLGYSDVAFPPEWQQGSTLRMRLWLLHCFPLWQHYITVSCVDHQQHRLQTEESGGWIKNWNHTLSVYRDSNYRTVYRDEIDINAGWLTPAAWLIAHLFYRYRQRRWHR